MNSSFTDFICNLSYFIIFWMFFFFRFCIVFEKKRYDFIFFVFFSFLLLHATVINVLLFDLKISTTLCFIWCIFPSENGRMKETMRNGCGSASGLLIRFVRAWRTEQKTWIISRPHKDRTEEKSGLSDSHLHKSTSAAAELRPSSLSGFPLSVYAPLND